MGQNLTSIASTSRVGLQCGTVYWRWLYFHVVWCLMIAVVSTRIKLLCLLERVEPCLQRLGSYPMNNIISVIIIISYKTI